MKNKLYEGRELKDFRELVSLYKNEYKDLTAFEFKKNIKDTEYVKVKYSEFAKNIENLGANLMKMNVKRVCIVSSNRYEWYVSYLAITTAGFVVVPLDKALTDYELEDSIVRSKADAVIYSDKYKNAVENAKKRVEDKTNKEKDAPEELKPICMDTENFKNMMKNTMNTDTKPYKNVKIDNKKMSIMLFTSGTTSASKAVMISQYAICEDLYALSQMIDIKTSDVFLSFLPLHHTFESTTTFLFGTSCGLTIAVCDGLKYVTKNLAEYNVTGFVAVPLVVEVMYKKIMKTIEEQHKTKTVNFMRKLFRHAPINVKRKVFKQIINAVGGSLKTLIIGGAPIDKEALQAFNDFGFDVHQGYGLTETSPVIAGENSFYKRTGSVGFPLPGIEIKTIDADENGIGELIVKTPTIMNGYYENKEETDEVLKDGWFYTGDLGYVDKDGFVFITGRKKDMIVLKNGKKVFPEEIETLISKIPYVSESMIFGLEESNSAKKDRDEDIVIYAKIVYNKDEITKAFPNAKKEDYKELIFGDIKKNVNDILPIYKHIKKIIVTEKPLIKTTTQKTKRREEMKIIKEELEK